MLYPLYRVTFISPTLSRRVSFASHVGLKDQFYDVTFLATAIQIMSKYPSDYPCPQIETMFDLRADSTESYKTSDLECLYISKSKVPFNFPKI